MAQAKQPGRDKSLASLHKATDTLSTMLAQEVKELNARQKAQRGDTLPLHGDAQVGQFPAQILGAVH